MDKNLILTKSDKSKQERRQARQVGLQNKMRRQRAGWAPTKGFSHRDALQETHQGHHGQPGPHALREERGAVSDLWGRRGRVCPGSRASTLQLHGCELAHARKNHLPPYKEQAADSCSASVCRGRGTLGTGRRKKRGIR